MANKLKAITSKAKALYKSGKYSKWTDAIKAASKQIAGVAPKKKPTKKAAVKKVAAKKAISKMHKDTKSHNVNIRVVSGVGSNNNIYKVRDLLEKDIQYIFQNLKRMQASLPGLTQIEKVRTKQNIASTKKLIVQLKKQLNEQNRLIKQVLK